MDFNGKILEKKFGQNFLTDGNLLKAIVADAGINKTDNILEIGTGAATLTKALSENANKVVSYEIDQTLEPLIKNNLQNADNVEIIFEDFLKSQEQDIIDILGADYKVIANIPYYITSPIIFKLIDFAHAPNSITIMVQYEVGERITAKPGSKEYGAITVGINSKYDTKILRRVKKEMFVPPPKVDSCIVHFTPNSYQIKDQKFFRRVVKSAFHMRRKQLINNLSTDFNLSKEELKSILNSLNINVNIRGEDMSIQQFISLSQTLYDYINKL
ncbi:MAG TPA: 16S rRNA (adenine(1518)-N(6)/adenine(1519)-N(6))-dimethyltransferase RsmA [Clostridia bacterium]